MSSLPSPKQNHLLAALPAAEFDPLAAHLQRVPMQLGEILYEPGEQLQYAYFPTTAIVSLHYVIESGASAEIAGVGNEGVVGISLFMGGDTTPSSAVVQTAGHAYRLPRHLLKSEFERGGPLQRLLLRYTQALITQMAQTAVCNRHHSIEQQLCRWLLVTLDRVPSGELVMTQELVASMLGVRREGITEAAGKLQQAGVIRYRRGHISVLDRTGLEGRSCECYGVVKAEIDRLLTDFPRGDPFRATSAPILSGPARSRAPSPCAQTWPAPADSCWLVRADEALSGHMRTMRHGPRQIERERRTENHGMAASAGRSAAPALARSSRSNYVLNDVLYQPGELIRDVLFPTASYISLITAVGDHDRLEVGLVGDEGMLGTSLLLGVSEAPTICLVQGAGPAWRMDAAAFRRELARSPALERGLSATSTSRCGSWPRRRPAPAFMSWRRGSRAGC